MTWHFIRIQNEEMWISGELNSRAVHVSFILEARGRSHVETLDVQEIPNVDKLTRLLL